MGPQEMIGLVLVLLIMGVGLIGCVMPGLPGTPLVLIAAIGHRLYFGSASIGNVALGLLVLLTLLSLGLDYLAGVLGARKMGATWRGVVGAGLGGVVGLFFGPPGILLGPFLGAVIFELIGGQEFERAARAGVGAMVGLLLGAVGKAACCVVMIGLFTFNVISHSGTKLEATAPAQSAVCEKIAHG